MIIAAHVVGATSAFLALKGSFTEELDNVTRAVQEMQQAGICSDCSVTIVRGPDEYLFGEEKALLEVIEGKPPMPRLLAPHMHGLFATAPQTGWPSVELAPGHSGRPASTPPPVHNRGSLATTRAAMAGGGTA